jgi:hypothetical protein
MYKKWTDQDSNPPDERVNAGTQPARYWGRRSEAADSREGFMKYARMLVLVPAVLAVAACGRDESRTDDALKNDLALASQAQPFNPQQFTSPAEMGYVYNPYTGQFQPVPQTPYPQAQPAPVVQRVATRPATVRRTSSTGARSTSGGTRVVYQEPQVVKRNTKRDAAIGAAAGAVIGATVSRDKLKGAVIGAAAGGVLGGIIGHTIDVERRP